MIVQWQFTLGANSTVTEGLCLDALLHLAGCKREDYLAVQIYSGWSQGSLNVWASLELSLGLSTDWQGSSSAGKDLGSWWPKTFWSALGGVSPAGQGRWSFISAQHWREHPWSPESSSGVPSTKETWTYWSQSSEGHQAHYGLEHRVSEERLREQGQFSANSRRPEGILLLPVTT